MTNIKWINTLRITGLLFVLIYHFFKEILPGGVIGVEIFFTLSGFLVTLSVVEEFKNSGNFRLFALYKRRFMRLYPPLLLSVLFTLAFALFLSPDFTAAIGR
ncbi:MAG: acyltransferase family protein, partial [Treponema sp.]|nr:acyltransferase family protein [Treponema sp.]